MSDNTRKRITQIRIKQVFTVHKKIHMPLEYFGNEVKPVVDTQLPGKTEN